MLQHQFLKPSRFLALLLAGLAPAGAASAQAAPVLPGPGCVADGAPQTGLPIDRLAINTVYGPARFHVQIAADDTSRERGLMFVRKLADNEGMIFDFKQAQDVAFWMHNTYIPLDLLFVRDDGKILSIARHAPTCSDAPIPSGGPVRTVIELNAGTADKRHIREGDYVTSTVIYPYR